jgi:hypothetical protein
VIGEREIDKGRETNRLRPPIARGGQDIAIGTRVAATLANPPLRRMHLEASNGRSWRSGLTPMTARSWQWASPTGSRTDELPTRLFSRVRGTTWLRGSIDRDKLEVLRRHARESILDVNDGITPAAGIAESFISAGASTRT